MPEAFEKIRNAAETGETTVQIDGTSGALSFTADRYGMSSILEIGFDNQQLAAALGLRLRRKQCCRRSGE